jgi:predicted carbohydrate-binding protein with CBM48
MDDRDQSEIARRVAEAYRRPALRDPDAGSRLMRRIRGEPRPRRRAGLAGWLRQPPALELSLASAAIAAVILLGIGMALGVALRAPVRTPGTGLAGITGEVHIVRFVHVAPGASRVAVVGDFNGWDPDATPMQRDGHSAWTASVPVPAGRHVYAFMVDGDHWMPDPASPLAPEDGFGTRNSVIVVGGTDAI